MAHILFTDFCGEIPVQKKPVEGNLQLFPGLLWLHLTILECTFLGGLDRFSQKSEHNEHCEHSQNNLDFCQLSGTLKP